MSISIYIPYFYIIQHINSGKYYAGAKYGIKANPEALLKCDGYKTSSNIIKQIIIEEGLESFIIRKIKTFETGKEALIYESRFLRRVNAAFNDNFLNLSNNSLNTLNTDYNKIKQTCLNKYGVENPSQSKEIQEKRRDVFLEKYGVENPYQAEEIKEKIKLIFLEKYGVEHQMQLEEIKEKIKQTNLERYGVEYISQLEDVKRKKIQTSLKKYGYENQFQSEEIKEKIKQTMLEKYGVENPSQSLEIREKKRQSSLVKYGVEYPCQSPKIQEKKRQNRIALNNRPTVLEIIQYKEKFKPKLMPYWIYKKQEILDSILEELKMIYGDFPADH